MLARDLALRGIEVHVFCRIVRAPAPPGVTLHVMPPWPMGPLLELLLFSGWAARAIRRWETRNGRFDVRHAFGRTLGQDVYRVGGGSHRTYLEHAHALDRPPWLRRILAVTPLQRLKIHMETRALTSPGPAVVIANSSMVRDDLERRHALPRERLVVIRNGVDLDVFRPPTDAERSVVRRSWGLDGSHGVALMVGSAYARKGLEPALRALALLAPGQERLRLVIVGKDRRPRLWQDLAARLGVGDRVIWLGACAAPEVAYRGADLLLLPTAYDAAANSTLEALASGLPVVTSSMNGAAEILDPERHGTVVRTPVRPAELAKAIERWLRPSDGPALARATRALAEQYPAGRSCDGVLEVYRRIGAAPAPIGASP